jgi:predicted transcriptional regulator
MTTTTIRVSAKTHDTLRDLARAVGAPMQQIIEDDGEGRRLPAYLT